MSERIPVPGVILIMSCQPLFRRRFEKHNPGLRAIEGWPIVYCVADPRLDRPFLLQRSSSHTVGDLLIIRSEDGYIHLLKKLSLACSALGELYAIQNGILKLGDDIFINMRLVPPFLRDISKKDFIGHNYGSASFDPNGKSFVSPYVDDDTSMLAYYSSRPSEVVHPDRGLGGRDISKMTRRHRVPACGVGTAIYLSNLATDIVTMDKKTGAYDYIIEDVGLAFILFKHGLAFTDHPTFFANTSDPLPTHLFSHTAIQGHDIVPKSRVKLDMVS
jgi:hypothetical protein